MIHYVCKSNESKPLKFLLRGPLGESVFDVRLIYAKTRSVVYSASLRNSILANYQSDFWKVKGRILVFFYSLHRECFSVLASSSRLWIKQTQKRWQNFLVISLVYFSNYVIDGEYYRFHCVGYVVRIYWFSLIVCIRNAFLYWHPVLQISCVFLDTSNQWGTPLSLARNRKHWSMTLNRSLQVFMQVYFSFVKIQKLIREMKLK